MVELETESKLIFEMKINFQANGFNFNYFNFRIKLLRHIYAKIE